MTYLFYELQYVMSGSSSVPAVPAQLFCSMAGAGAERSDCRQGVSYWRSLIWDHRSKVAQHSVAAIHWPGQRHKSRSCQRATFSLLLQKPMILQPGLVSSAASCCIHTHAHAHAHMYVRMHCTHAYMHTYMRTCTLMSKRYGKLDFFGLCTSHRTLKARGQLLLLCSPCRAAIMLMQSHISDEALVVGWMIHADSSCSVEAKRYYLVRSKALVN